MTANTLESRLRQIAILVASVDTTAARQLLMHLPTEIAKRVRAMAVDIGPVPPEERMALLAEFQRSQSLSKANSAPAIDSNTAHQDLTARAFAEFASASSKTAPEADSGPSWTRLGVDALVRLVRMERPTVIAVVLQQLSPTQVSAVLQRLPRTTTKDALRALGGLQDIDDEAMRAIDEHLSERLRDYHHKIETELEQTRRMNELLAAAPADLKQQWASWMRPDVFKEEDQADGRPGSATLSAMNTLDNLYKSAQVTTNDPQVKATGSPTGLGGTQQQLATSQQSDAMNVQPVTTKEAMPEDESDQDEGPRTIPFPGPKSRSGAANTTSIDRNLLRGSMERMLTLPPHSLAELLSRLDSETILLALAGASTKFMKKFRSMLEPEDAKVLDDRIQRIGPVLLRQIDEAQQRMVHAYQAYITPDAQRRAA